MSIAVQVSRIRSGYFNS